MGLQTECLACAKGRQIGIRGLRIMTRSSVLAFANGQGYYLMNTSYTKWGLFEAPNAEFSLFGGLGSTALQYGNVSLQLTSQDRRDARFAIAKSQA